MIEIRPIETYDDARCIVGLQEEIWGRDFGEIVPAAILWAAVRAGGILAGAWEAEILAGFVFGLTGFRAGAPMHWSDMLAVMPAFRGRGIATLLKSWQRDRLLDAGIDLCNWTFDPLEARNARLNLNALGATSAEYVPACYGISRSPLHRGLPTDRLIADWRVGSARVRQRMEGARPDIAPAGPLINPAGAAPDLDLDEPRLRLLIPADMRALDDTQALVWREHTRAAFETYFGRGYRAMEVLPQEPGGYTYLLVRE